MKKDFYKEAVDASPIGFAYHKVLYDEAGEISDYIFLDMNVAFEKFAGLKASEVIGKSVTTCLPLSQNSGMDWKACYGDKFAQDVYRTLNGADKAQEETKIGFSHEAHWPDQGHYVLYLTNISREMKQMKESEENFRTYFETVDDLIVVSSLNGEILYTNDAYARKLGYTHEALKTMTVLDLHPEEVRTEAEAIFAEMLAGRVETCPLPLKKHDGVSLPVETRVWVGKWNGTECIFGISKDLTNQQAALDKFHRLFDNNPAPMAISSVPEQIIIDVNEAFVRKLGYVKEELLGKKTSEIGLFLNPEKQLQIAEMLKNEGQIKNVELQVRTKSGDVIEGLFFGEVIDNELDQTFLTVMTDITAQKQLEGNIRKLKEQAELANAMKSQFLANMSHEIRTPMNGIMGYLGLLHQTELSDVQSNYVEEAQRASEILLYLINDILDFTKIEAGKLIVDGTLFKIQAVMDEVVNLVALKAQEKNIQIKTSLMPGVPREVIGDHGRLRQILNNLLSNAVKFTDVGEISMRVVCLGQKNGKIELCFEVCDTGIGIRPEDCDKLFSPFIQVDASTTRKYGGTGLGLAISKELARLMKGDLKVKSELGKGTTFYLTVEVDEVEDQGEIAGDDLADLEGLNVLIVDADVVRRRNIKNSLEKAHCQVFEAGNSDETLSKILVNAETVDEIKVVLIDDEATDVSSYQLAGMLKNLGTTRSMKSILLLGENPQPLNSMAKEDGFSLILKKTVGPKALMMAITKVLNDDSCELCSNVNGSYVKANSEDKVLERHKPKILLVEDNEMNQNLVKKVLALHNFTCDVAANGEEAVMAVLQKSYDLVFMDCQMPVMDGYESTMKIRSLEPKGRHTIIIAMTAHAMEGDREKCLAVGMDDYMSKPLDFNLMFQKISENQNNMKGKKRNLLEDSMADFMKSSGIDLESAQEVFEEYIGFLPEIMERLKTAVASGSFKDVRALGHQLKGASGNLRITEVYDLALLLEDAAKNENIGECEELLSRIQLVINL